MEQTRSTWEAEAVEVEVEEQGEELNKGDSFVSREINRNNI